MTERMLSLLRLSGIVGMALLRGGRAGKVGRGLRGGGGGLTLPTGTRTRVEWVRG